MTPWDGKCPGCEGVMFLAGPRGGEAQNIMCINHACRQKLNVSRWRGALLLIDVLPVAAPDEYSEWLVERECPFYKTDALARSLKDYFGELPDPKPH